jgi:hypothetical protein
MIYISYGFTKSASTFLYQLIEEVYRAAGRKPARLDPPFRRPLSLDNYVNVIDAKVLQEVVAQANGRDVVLKTHGGAHPDIVPLVESGDVLASASVRDPREMALSMIDHGRRSRQWGYEEFSAFHTPRDTLASLDEQMEWFRSWTSLPRVPVFAYNDICFDTPSVVERLAAQIGVAVRTEDVLLPFRSNRGIGQYSKGAALRYQEMSAEDQALFLERYAPLYQDYSFENPAAESVAATQRHRPAPGQLSLMLRNIGRIVRI